MIPSCTTTLIISSLKVYHGVYIANLCSLIKSGISPCPEIVKVLVFSLYSQWIELFSPISPLVCPLACREEPISPSSRAMSHSVRCSLVLICLKSICVVDKKGEDEDLPSSPLPRNAEAVLRVRSMCVNQVPPREETGNPDGRVITSFMRRLEDVCNIPREPPEEVAQWRPPRR